jgi:hypothetical protein
VRTRASLTVAALLVATVLTAKATLAQIDPSGDWRTWQSEHFRIHAPRGYDGLVMAAAREAERSYRLLSTELRPPRGTIDLVVADNVDFSNAFASVLPSNRMAVYVTPPSSSISTGNYDDWLRLVLTHELTHIFHLDRADGVWGVLQTAFGRAPGLFPNTYQPQWVIEGLATYYESRFTSAGRVKGAFHSQLLAGASRDGAWPAPGEATYANSVWPSGTRSYAWGSRFLEAQRAAFGDSIIPRFVNNTSRQLIVFNVSDPMKSAGTDGVDPGWERLKASSSTVGRTGEIVVRGLWSEPRPRLSSDGTLLAYRHYDGRSVERIIVFDMRKGARITDRTANAVEGMAWVDGSLYVTQMEFDSRVQIRSDLYRLEPGTGWARLTRGSRNTDVFRLPGERIGVIALDSGRRHVKEMDLRATETTALGVPEADDWGRLVVSPDGARIAAVRHLDGHWDVVIWPSGRPGEAQLITNDHALDADPVWAADGRSLLFSSERQGLPQIYQYDTETGFTWRLTDEPTGAREPAVAPDGKLFYSTILGDGFALMVQRDHGRFEDADSFDARPDFADADSVTLDESGYRPWPALRPYFWIPFFHEEGSAGTFLGALTGGADPIGRTGYTSLLTVAPATDRAEALLSLVHSRWRAWSVDLTVAQTWDRGGSLPAIDGSSAPISFRERSAEAGLRYGWRRWRAGISWRLGGFIERDELINDGSAPLTFVHPNPTFAGMVMSANVGRGEWPALAISRENGGSLTALYSKRWELGGGNWSYEFRGGVNGYLAFPLPGFAHWVLAGRVSGGISGGTAPNLFSVGGESGDPVQLVPGSTIGSGRRKFPMRGYSQVGLFTRVFVAVSELRIPLLVAGQAVGKLPILIDKVSANVFWEVGGGWTSDEDPDPAGMMDVGAELVSDLGVGAGVLRIRLGWAIPLRHWLGTQSGDSRVYLTFGPSF